MNSVYFWFPSPSSFGQITQMVEVRGEPRRKMNVKDVLSPGSRGPRTSSAVVIHCSLKPLGVLIASQGTWSPVLLVTRQVWSIDAALVGSRIHGFGGDVVDRTIAVCSSSALADRWWASADKEALEAARSAASIVRRSYFSALSRAASASLRALRASTTWKIAITAAIMATISIPRLIQFEASTAECYWSPDA